MRLLNPAIAKSSYLLLPHDLIKKRMENNRDHSDNIAEADHDAYNQVRKELLSTG